MGSLLQRGMGIEEHFLERRPPAQTHKYQYISKKGMPTVITDKIMVSTFLIGLVAIVWMARMEHSPSISWCMQLRSWAVMAEQGLLLRSVRLVVSIVNINNISVSILECLSSLQTKSVYKQQQGDFSDLAIKDTFQSSEFSITGIFHRITKNTTNSHQTNITFRVMHAHLFKIGFLIGFICDCSFCLSRLRRVFYPKLTRIIMIYKEHCIYKSGNYQRLYQLMNKRHHLTLCLLLIVAASSYSCCDANTLSISGAATVKVAPDLATFTATATGYGKTSLLALSNVNSLISQASAILQAAGLPAANYTTSSINLYPQYDYSNSMTVLVGQQASQTLQVTIGNITLNKNRLGQIGASLAGINNITLSGFSFQNSDTTAAYRQARLAAVRDASSKATQYVSLSGRRLGSVRKVEDQNSESYVPFFLSSNEYAFRVQSLPVPFGQVQVSASVKIDWNIRN